MKTKEVMDRPAPAEELLALLLKSEGVTYPQVQGITRRAKADSFPLSFAQERLWFFDQLEPGNALYNIPQVIRLRGTLNVPALERSLSEIVRRHEVLRTSFLTIDGQPVQIISTAQPLTIPVIDLSHLAEADCEVESQRLASEEARRAFNLEVGPLLRASLLRLGAGEHVLLLTMHHIVSDGWSLGLVMRELSALYEAYTRGQASPLEELPIQYADYAVWQREWLQGERLEEQLSYWREHLCGAPAVLEFPTDHPRPAVQSFNGARLSLELSEELSQQLRALSQQAGVTLFMTLLAAFQLLLSRYSRQSDIVTGTPIAGRTRSETESLVGFFINTLVLRTDCSRDPTFTELLGRVKEVCLGAYAHQDVPFEKLVEELEPERDLSRNPLFQVMFVLQNAPRQQARLSGLEMHALPVNRQKAVVDLSLIIMGREARLNAVMQYNTDLFEAETIKRLLGHYERLLESIVADPQHRVSELEWLSEEERHQLLFEWNDTSREYPKDKCIHQLFEEQAERTPGAVALVFEEEELSYRELNERANQLAHHLRSLGVGPDLLVGIGLARSLQMVVGLLAILKAGGAYLPLDPAYPQERLSFMLDDAQARVLITEEELLSLFAGQEQEREIVCLERDAEEIANQPTTNLSQLVMPEHLAYVIYTSGSTGTPKGVAARHTGLINLVSWHLQAYSVTEADRASQVASVSFDASAWELWPYLAAGASLHIMGEEVRAHPAKLLRWLQEEHINICFLPTPLAEAMLTEPLPEGLRLRYLLTGGDVLHAGAWGELPFAVVNHYGPTECTVVGTACEVETAGMETGKWVSIGKAIGNTRVYVLDKDIQPVPVGVAGELYIGGDGLARGYLNRAELTAEKFVPHPFSMTEGARLYRTGDLVKHLPDGNIEFIGRIDQQVKIRGFRIELGEIEAVLLSSPAVRDCVVLAREDVPGDRRLVAYTVAEIGQALSNNELRSYLKERLPEYMIPGVFMQLDELPLTPNGKVDRRALPAPDGSRPDLQNLYVEPRTPVEEILAGIWREVLSVERVGINDNFFALGGHSLKATQVMSRVRQACAVELPLRSMFASPTVRELSEEVESRRAQGPKAGEEEVELKAVEGGGELPLSYAQQRLWFLDQLEPGSSFYHIPRALRMRGKLDTDALERSLSEIVRRHEVLRTSFPISDGQPLQLISTAQPLTMPVIDISQLPEIEREVRVQLHAGEETSRPFDLKTGPLLRACLLRLGAEEHVLLLTMHHIASDGWSIGVLMRELSVLYGAYTRGQASPLEELPIQYADYAVWQRKWLQGKVLQQQLQYWKQQLSGAPGVLELPTDHPRPPIQTFEGARQTMSFSLNLTQQLRALSQRASVTLFMTLLAAFQLLLSRYSRQSDIVVGTPIAGRTRSETESLIGFFTNTLVLRTDCSVEQTFTELLGRVREVCLGAYAHQDVPFEKLVEELEPERDLSHNPLFQVMFALQNQSMLDSPEIPGLSLGVLAVEDRTAKFDLYFSIVETTQGLSSSLRYNRNLFEAETIKRLLGHFERLLESIVADPQHRVSELEWLSEEERHQLLFEWNDTSREYPKDKCIHQLFEEQAERTPGAVALVFEEEELSYRELNERANQLAHHLRSLGVGPEVLVGILVERSMEMVIGLLGILKAGGAYVPLDPAYPQERLSFMLEDAGAKVLVTQRRLGGLIGGRGVTVLELDSAREAIARQSVEQPCSGVMAGNLAYVIYTSGSTGKPKGVQITHQAVSNFLDSTIRRLGLTGESAWLAVTSLSFDIAVLELFGSMIAGVKLVIATREASSSGTQLRAAVDNFGVSVMQATPTTWSLLKDAGWQSSGHQLKKLCGGEALSLELATRLLKGNGPVWNLYGPTETTVWSAIYQVETLGDSKRSTPIGGPIDNTQIYLLDKSFEPVPVGVAGELYIGGDGLARGYLNRAELTAERFVPHPFSITEGARLYRTGDLVKYLPDGNIEFIGRIDQQVKVRGFRIELGEVEAVLGTHAGVNDCVVIVREDTPGDARLVAYIEAAQAGGPSNSELRSFLKGSLPEYMMPSVFIMLDKFPLTPNGKIDRKALPAPDGARPDTEDTFVVPNTPLERQLAEVWSAVLKMEQIGIHDNFFALGGHSLLATQVVSRVRQSLHVELPLRDFFESPTISGMVTAIDKSQNNHQRMSDLKVQAVPRNDIGLDQLLAELDQLSESEVQSMLAQEMHPVEAGSGAKHE